MAVDTTALKQKTKERLPVDLVPAVILVTPRLFRSWMLAGTGYIGRL